jgi:hypothetical protein
VADVQPSQIRIGDTERESALAALGEHMSAGRLDIDEYGDRTARVSTAKTRGELVDLFGDLPQPHPSFGVAPQPVAMPAQQSQAVPVRRGATLNQRLAAVRRGATLNQRLAAVAVPAAAIVALALFFAVHWWVVFLIPAAVTLFGGAIWGEDWKHNKRLARERYRQERREIRRRGRGW